MHCSPHNNEFLPKRRAQLDALCIKPPPEVPGAVPAPAPSLAQRYLVGRSAEALSAGHSPAAPSPWRNTANKPKKRWVSQPGVLKAPLACVVLCVLFSLSLLRCRSALRGLLPTCRAPTRRDLIRELLLPQQGRRGDIYSRKCLQQVQLEEPPKPTTATELVQTNPKYPINYPRAGQLETPRGSQGIWNSGQC